MPSQDNINQQLGLLQINRNNIALYERQKANMGGAYVPPGIINGLAEARRNIARIKQNLRGWGVQVEDMVMDTAAPQEFAVTAPDLPIIPNERQAQVNELLEHFDQLEDQIREGQRENAIRHIRLMRRLLNALAK